MPIDVQFETGNLCVMCINGVLTHEEFRNSQKLLGRRIEAGAQPGVLVLLVNFEGWEAGANWNDLGFMLREGTRIRRIAIVGDPHWEAQALMFAGAGYRPTAVKFFPTARLSEARSWIAEVADTASPDGS